MLKILSLFIILSITGYITIWIKKHPGEIAIEWQGENENEVGLYKNTQKVLVKVDKKYFRPCEVELLLGDSSKARNKLGWKPECDNLDKLIDSMLN